VDAPLIDANLVVERGEISFPATPARVTRGTVVASAQPNAEGQLTTRIMVDILAEARIGATRIFIPMTGPLDNLRMDPYSIPTMTRDEIMAMLLGQEAWAQTVGRSPSEAAALSSVATGLISAGLGMTFLRPVEHLLAQSLNLEEFTILYSGQQPIRLRMGRYLAANLYLTYTTIPLGAGDRSDSLRLSYQITPRFSVGYSIIHRAAGVGTQAPTERRLEIDSSFRF
jgi:autotransporter translocation and assembly factor TamB